MESMLFWICYVLNFKYHFKEERIIWPIFGLKEDNGTKLKPHVDMRYSALEFLFSILEQHLDSSLEEKL